MSIYDEAFSCADCNNLDDPKVHNVCDVDQTKHYQLPELGKFATKTAETMPFVEHLPSSSPSPPAPNKQSGPRPVDHAKALRQFFNLGRERNPNLVASELTLFERDIALREISKNQLRKYMLATDEEDPVDLKEWGRYELGPPKQVPTCDVNEVAERAAQLKLYCRWRKRVVQKRLEVRRQQLEAVHLALMKKHKGVHGPLLSLGSVWGSSKTAIADTSFLEEEQASTVTNKHGNAKKTTVDD